MKELQKDNDELRQNNLQNLQEKINEKRQEEEEKKRKYREQQEKYEKELEEYKKELQEKIKETNYLKDELFHDEQKLEKAMQTPFQNAHTQIEHDDIQAHVSVKIVSMICNDDSFDRAKKQLKTLVPTIKMKKKFDIQLIGQHESGEAKPTIDIFLYSCSADCLKDQSWVQILLSKIGNVAEVMLGFIVVKVPGNNEYTIQLELKPVLEEVENFLKKSHLYLDMRPHGQVCFNNSEQNSPTTSVDEFISKDIVWDELFKCEQGCKSGMHTDASDQAPSGIEQMGDGNFKGAKEDQFKSKPGFFDFNKFTEKFLEVALNHQNKNQTSLGPKSLEEEEKITNKSFNKIMQWYDEVSMPALRRSHLDLTSKRSAILTELRKMEREVEDSIISLYAAHVAANYAMDENSIISTSLLLDCSCITDTSNIRGAGRPAALEEKELAKLCTDHVSEEKELATNLISVCTDHVNEYFVKRFKVAANHSTDSVATQKAEVEKHFMTILQKELMMDKCAKECAKKSDKNKRSALEILRKYEFLAQGDVEKVKEEVKEGRNTSGKKKHKIDFDLNSLIVGIYEDVTEKYSLRQEFVSTEVIMTEVKRTTMKIVRSMCMDESKWSEIELEMEDLSGKIQVIIDSDTKVRDINNMYTEAEKRFTETQKIAVTSAEKSLLEPLKKSLENSKGQVEQVPEIIKLPTQKPLRKSQKKLFW